MQYSTIARRSRGLSLIEVMVFITIVAVAMAGTMYSYIRHVTSKTITEERRLACIAAEQKLDEIRNFIRRVPAGNAFDASGNLISDKTNPLDAAFNLYGPLPLATALNRPCCFNVANLNPINNASVGTVSFITDESPDAANFGIIYGSPGPTAFGVNLYGDIYQDGNFPASVPVQAPFPLDINGNGTTNDKGVANGFILLPVVITIRWLDPTGARQRFDLFCILQSESGAH